MFKLRFYQQATIDHAVAWAQKANPGDTQLYAGPTGCGKSVVEWEIKCALGQHWYIITPRLEIARGFLEKVGLRPGNLKELVTMSQTLGIYTPIRFRNMLRDGLIPRIDGLIVDEGHHQLADSYRDIWLGGGMPPIMLFTATPYRGTSKATAAFIKEYGEALWIVTMREAASYGHISVPMPEILPLVDDDLIELNAQGDFDVTSIENHMLDRIQDMARIADERYYNGREWDRATVFCMPTVSMAHRMAAALKAPSNVVFAKTSDSDRIKAFTQVRARTAALVQVSVLGEGVDLPLRRSIDMSPCMSPVKWMQGPYGRITRPTEPGEARPEYVVTNRNLLRHAYLLEGLCPPSKIAEATELFGVSARAGHRALGLEALGRFKAVNVALLDGNVAQFYILADASNGKLTEYGCLCHPTEPEPFWGVRKHGTKPDGSRDWGRWERVTPPTELRGFVSQAGHEPTQGQVDFWKKKAASCGLNPDVKLTRKNFAAMPFCLHLGLRLASKP